jgi:hypothetical protein
VIIISLLSNEVPLCHCCRPYLYVCKSISFAVSVVAHRCFVEARALKSSANSIASACLRSVSHLREKASAIVAAIGIPSLLLPLRGVRLQHTSPRVEREGALHRPGSSRPSNARLRPSTVLRSEMREI